MLKVVGKVLIILLVAGLVVAATYAISRNVSLTQFGGRGDGDFGAGFDRGGLQQNGATGQFARGHLAGPGGGGFRGEREGGSAFGWMEVLKGLGVIALVTAGVILVQKIYEGSRTRKRSAMARPGV
jgi:hypothetical protein